MAMDGPSTKSSVKKEAPVRSINDLSQEQQKAELDKAQEENKTSIKSDNNMEGRDGNTPDNANTAGVLTSYVSFPCEVVSLTDDSVVISYSRNSEKTGELDTSFAKRAEFAADKVENFDDLAEGEQAEVLIDHATLTDELLTYEETKQAVE
jgi:hypothetical protein